MKRNCVLAFAAAVTCCAVAGQLRVREAGLFVPDRQAASAGRHTKNAAAPDASAAAAKAVVALSDRLGIAVAPDDLRVRRADADAFGRTHVRLQQLFGGVEVDGRELIVHFDAAGAVYEVNGDWLDTSALAPFPAPSAQVAGATLAVYCKGDDASAARLAWRRREGRSIVFTDAQTGATLHVRRVAPHALDDDDDDGDGMTLDLEKIISYATSKPFPAGSATTLAARLPAQHGGAEVEIPVTRGSDGAARFVATTAEGIEVGVLDGIASPAIRAAAKAADAAKLDWTAAFLARTGWTKWSDNAAEDMPNAVAIMHNVVSVLGYYKSAFNRLSYDGKGGRVASWRFWQDEAEDLDTGYANAFWTSLGDDANGKAKGCFFFGYDVSGKRSETSLDTCAHELTHGVTSWSANLQYEAESGALNESFSDLIGAACEFAVQPRAADPTDPAPGEADWLFDEDSGSPARSFADPQLCGQPSRYKGKKWVKTSDTSEDNDNGGVHDNSGVQNHFFYLLCEGGRGVNDGIEYDLKGIGVEKGAQLAYLTLTAYCGPRTDYAAVTGCWDSAALDLVASGVLGEEDYAAVAPAWAAVMGSVAGGEFSAAGECAYAGEVGAGQVLLVKTGKANGRGLFKTTATLYEDGRKVALFSGPKTSGPEVALRNRKYGTLLLTLGGDAATCDFETLSESVAVERIAPAVDEVEGLDGLRVGIAAKAPLALTEKVAKVRWSAKRLPRGVKVARDGTLAGAPAAAGEGVATLSASCTVAVPGVAKTIAVKVARDAAWRVAAMDGFAHGKFVGEGLAAKVTAKGRITGTARAGGRRVRISAKSFDSYDDGTYSAFGKTGPAEWMLSVTADGMSLAVETPDGSFSLAGARQ